MGREKPPRVKSDEFRKGPLMVDGLIFKNVNHVIDRPCKWYQAPHHKKAWRLTANKWRKFEESKGKVTGDDTAITKQKLKTSQLQFKKFLEGFFSQENIHSLKLIRDNLSFEDIEKQEMLEKYFKEYYNKSETQKARKSSPTGLRNKKIDKKA